jgi:hypothetical protein
VFTAVYARGNAPDGSFGQEVNLMLAGTRDEQAVATVDVAQLNTLRWGPMRQLFPSFVENIELGRYLKGLLASEECQAVQLEPHRNANGTALPRVFDVYLVAAKAKG